MIFYSKYHPLSADTSFKFLALILFEIWHLQNFIPCFSKGCNFTRGDNSEKMPVCYFSMRNPYIQVSRRYFHAPYILTYIRTSRNQYAPNLLAHLTRRLIGERIVYQWSGVRRPSTFSNIFFSKTAWPIKAKFYV